MPLQSRRSCVREKRVGMRFVFVSEEPGYVQLYEHGRYEGARVRKYRDEIDGSEPALGTVVSTSVPFESDGG